MVGVSGFEPPTSTSRTWRASHCATPRLWGYYSTAWGGFDNPFPAQIRKKLQFPKNRSGDMGIPAQNLWRWPRTLPGIALIFGLILGLMAVALSCGGSAEYAESAAAPASGVGQSDTASDIAPELLPQQLGASGGGRIELGPAEPAEPAGPSGPAGPQGGAGPDGAAAARPTPAPEIVVETARAASEAGQPASTAPRRGAATDDGESDGASSSSLSAQTNPQTGRQLIVEAWISLQVDAIDPLARQVEALAAQRGGWVESADILGEGGYRSAAIHIRVPAERFNNAMEALRALGAVTDEGISSADVTDRLIDNEARMTAWRAQEERLIALLENAATVEDIVDIEKRISEVRADIEQVAATQRDLQNRVAASLIRVNLHLPPRFAADPPTGQMTLAVGDPPAAGDAIIARVRARNGYIGQKREYRQGQGDAVELTAFVKSTDLAALMDYAATLGEITDRRLDSVGPSPDSDAPNARLSLVIHSNVDSAAALSLSAVDAIAVAGQIRAYAEARGGYVESWGGSAAGGQRHRQPGNGSQGRRPADGNGLRRHPGPYRKLGIPGRRAEPGRRHPQRPPASVRAHRRHGPERPGTGPDYRRGRHRHPRDCRRRCGRPAAAPPGCRPANCRPFRYGCRRRGRRHQRPPPTPCA